MNNKHWHKIAHALYIEFHTQKTCNYISVERSACTAIQKIQSPSFEVIPFEKEGKNVRRSDHNVTIP